MYKVYKHTSPSGKVYIGITCRSLNDRWRNGNGYRHSPHFMSAINKYGWDNIQHELLFDGLTQEEAEQKEIELIERYKATDREFGYNSCSGGNVNWKHSEETKEKIRQAHIGMKYSEDFCKRQSKLKIGNKNMFGKHHSDKTKKKISEKNKGRFAGEKNYFHNHVFMGGDSPHAVAVERYDKDGKYIDCRDCGADYARELNLKNASHIFEVCKGKRKTAHGFIWKYKGAV